MLELSTPNDTGRLPRGTLTVRYRRRRGKREWHGTCFTVWYDTACRRERVGLPVPSQGRGGHMSLIRPNVVARVLPVDSTTRRVPLLVYLVIPVTLLMLAACGRDDQRMDELLRADLAAAAQAPSMRQQYASPQELGYPGAMPQYPTPYGYAPAYSAGLSVAVSSAISAAVSAAGRVPAAGARRVCAGAGTASACVLERQRR